MVTVAMVTVTLFVLLLLECPDHCSSCSDKDADDVTECLVCDQHFHQTTDLQCDCKVMNFGGGGEVKG